MLSEALHNALISWIESDSPRGVFVTDPQLVIQSWNRWMETHTGIEARQVIGTRLLEAFPELEERKTARFYSRALRGESVVLSQRFHGYLLKMPAEETVPFACMQQTARIAPLVASGQIQGTITVIEDVTERIAYEAELQAARLEAENANRSKDDFLAMVSHELRAPMANILGWARVLKKSDMERSLLEKAIDSIERNASLQSSLVEELIDIARITSGKLNVDMALVDIREVSSAAIETIRPIAEEKGIRLFSDIPGDWTVVGDMRRLQQVMVNLLSNATKFTPGGGEIVLRVRQSTDETTIEVQDNGIGIEPELLPYVFDRLRQGTGTGAKRQDGLGLGLAIVKHIVEAHAGIVTVTSPGKNEGTTFKVILPSVQSTISNASIEPSKLDPNSLTGLDLLIVEDNADTREVLSGYLKSAGAQVRTAESVPQGLAAIVAKAPDVILSDINIPGEDGYSLIHKLRNSHIERVRNIPAIAVTALSSADVHDKIIESGFQAHIVKPMGTQNLIDVVRSLTRSST